MKHPKVVSIDMGSAYTKVSIRAGWNADASLVRGAPAAQPAPDDYCIPSVIARVDSPAKSEWLIGVAAASQLPGEGVKLFRNWKPALFGTPAELAGSSARSIIAARDEAFIVAVEFFRRLRSALDQRLTKAEALDAPVRVCVPRFDDTASHELMERILWQAGWEPAGFRSVLFEPETNALGLLSRGRNATWFPGPANYRPRPQRTIDMPNMLQPTLARSFREMRDHHSVLVTDIGAFTTDFGYVDFDSSFKTKEWNRLRIIQKSYRLGIGELDRSVLSILNAEAQEFFQNASPGEWDLYKRDLYNGKPQKIVRRGLRTITVGDGDEGDAIQGEITCFAERVIAARAEFCLCTNAGEIREEILTGGGSNIWGIRRALLNKMSTNGTVVHDLLDPDEPKRATERGAGRMTLAEEEQRVRQNQALVRGGSAIGGASVFFEEY